MCRFAIDDTTWTTVIGAPKVKSVEGICSLKTQSTSLRDEINQSQGISMVVATQCPFYAKKEFTQCKYHKA